MVIYAGGVEPRKIFLIKRLIAALALGFAFIQVLPTLADVLNPTPDPTVVASPAVTPAPSVSPTDSPAPSASTTSSASPAPTASITYLHPTGSDSPTPEPTLADIQDVILRMPSTFPVDPRATSVHISPISVYGSEVVLVCINSGATINLMNSSSSVSVSGNGSHALLLSGDAADVNTVLNSGQGLRVGSTSRIQGSAIYIRAASVTKQTLNHDLCAEATKSASASVIALGLGMNTVKNPVPIK